MQSDLEQVQNDARLATDIKTVLGAFQRKASDKIVELISAAGAALSDEIVKHLGSDVDVEVVKSRLLLILQTGDPESQLHLQRMVMSPMVGEVVDFVRQATDDAAAEGPKRRNRSRSTEG